jgi:phosphoglycerate dehydrogenase-like enzyme
VTRSGRITAPVRPHDAQPGVDRRGFGSASANELPAPLARKYGLALDNLGAGMIGREVLSTCRGAVLINAGRGATVDEAVIPEALEKGWLAGAALDVFEVEPLPASSPLWDDRRVMISPHISGLTTVEGAVGSFLECLDEIERGQLPSRTVDRDRGY